MISASPELELLKAETRPGTCLGCDGALPKSKTKPRKICRAAECTRLYSTIHALGRRSGQGSFLRRVVERRRVELEDGRARVRLHLECGHRKTVAPSDDRGARTYCADCAAGRSIRCH